MMTQPGLFDEDERRVSAYHEAGHAVMALQLGVGVQQVALEPPVTTLRPPMRSINPHSRGAIALAASWATRHLLGLDEPLGTSDGAMLDAAIADIMSRFPGEGAAAYAAQCAVQVSMQLSLKHVRDVAERLLQARGPLGWKDLPRRNTTPYTAW
jgi:hypothetical protein